MAYSGGKMSAVDAILAEAADLVALEQIAKLNAHLADDSPLPSTLESRFRKLKSLPPAPAAAPVRTLSRSVTAPPRPALPSPPPQLNPPPPEQPPVPPAAKEEHPPPPSAEKGDSSSSSPPQQQEVPPPATVPAAHDDDEEDLEKLFGSSGRRGRPTLRERNRGLDDDDDAGGSPSPPPPRRQACCFGFSSSPRKALHKTSAKGKKVHGAGASDVLGVDAGEWGDENRRMVTELREQQRKLKKALEEQVKVSRETAKMATWVKQASARMTHAAAIDDLLSDCEDDDEL
ncbi:unnamed protein product [Urochloa humidicola]